MFELVIKKGEDGKREEIHRDPDFAQLVALLASRLLVPGRSGSDVNYSGARGEIEVGYSHGNQYLLRVMR